MLCVAGLRRSHLERIRYINDILYMMYMTEQKSITLPDDLVEYVEENHISLSKFVQEKLRERKEEENYPVPGYDSEYEYYKDYDDRPQIRFPANIDDLNDEIEKVMMLNDKQAGGEFDDKEETFILCFVQLPQGPVAVHKGESVEWVLNLLRQRKASLQEADTE